LNSLHIYEQLDCYCIEVSTVPDPIAAPATTVTFMKITWYVCDTCTYRKIFVGYFNFAMQ